MNPQNERWMAIDGSIVVERAVPTKFDRRPDPIPTHPAIAFNVGNDIAQHIVDIHNESLTTRLQDLKRLDYLDRDKKEHVLCIGGTWYYRDHYGAPCRKSTSVRDAVDKAIENSR